MVFEQSFQKRCTSDIMYKSHTSFLLYQYQLSQLPVSTIHHFASCWRASHFAPSHVVKRAGWACSCATVDDPFAILFYLFVRTCSMLGYRWHFWLSCLTPRCRMFAASPASAVVHKTSPNQRPQGAQYWEILRLTIAV